MKLSLSIVLLIICISSLANDTLYFHLANPWQSVKAPNGKYLRKAILTKDSGWLALDYINGNELVARGHFSDTSFNKKLYCHYYYSNQGQRLEDIKCYKNGKLDGNSIQFYWNGDTILRETYRENMLVDRKVSPSYDESIIFTKLEAEAEFPGGEDGWKTYLSQNLHYPKKAIKNNIQGRVLLQFEVDREGNISEIEVLNQVDPLLDEEAIRLIKTSPPWTPGMQNGRRVKSYKKVEIEFKLPG